MVDDNEYRQLCDRSDVMRRGDLRATFSRLEYARPDLAARLAALLSGPPVPKPSGHDGGPDTDFLWLDLATGEIEAILEAMAALEAALAESGAPNESLSSAADLVDIWNGAESSRSAT
jgi:hypothetical protein